MAITDEKYVLLTTFRKNGDAVPTPIWIVAMPDGTGGTVPVVACDQLRTFMPSTRQLVAIARREV